MNAKKIIFGALACLVLVLAACTDDSADSALYEQGVDKTKVRSSNSVDKTKVRSSNSVDKTKVRSSNSRQSVDKTKVRSSNN